MKICTILGARPQFVKASVVSRALGERKGIQEFIVHTGQHYDENMSTVFFEEMKIPQPSYNLGIQSGLHGEMTGRMMEGIEKIILKEKPDSVLVYGDTNSTLAGALAAVKLHVKLIHVEAGLRSKNMKMPEEINRILTDRISDLLCCPTEMARVNLEKEGFDNFKSIYLNTGDVMEDAAIYYSAFSEKKSKIIGNLKLNDFILCTLHRAENTNDPQRLAGIIDALNQIHTKIRIVLPLHPRTKKTVEALGLNLKFDVLPPLGYFDMLELLKHCRMVITDSGGLQKEAYFFRKPSVTMRDETEWPELIELGCNVLSGASKDKIITLVDKMLDYRFSNKLDLYGGGKAANSIVDAIQKYI